MKAIRENKDFFTKDLEKNIYLNGKNHIINLNILYFVINSKLKLKDFFETLKRILKTKTHQFSIDGNYLMKYGMKQGALMGKALEQIEAEWIRNNFKISKERIQELIRSYSS